MSWISMSERTHEIGIMRAVGASGAQVQSLFLGEAVGLALVGGAAGVALSLLVATVLLVASPELPFRMTPSMTPSMVGLALIIRMMTGAVSGWLPARRASRPDPATAIRARR